MTARLRFTSSTTRPRRRRGMTILEVVAAILIMTVCLLSMGVFVTRLARATRVMNLRNTASELVADRIEQVKGAVRYGAIDSVYAVTESTVPGSPGFTRQTLVSHVGGGGPDLDDYKIVTVVVTNPALINASKKTTIISAF